MPRGSNDWSRPAIDGALRDWRQPISAVCAATFWHSLLGVDASNRPVTPLLPWSDLRAEGESIRLRQTMNERQIHARTGCRFHASYWPARLAWFRRHEPGVLRRVHRWVTFGERLERQWLGRNGVSISQASGSGVLIRTVASGMPVFSTRSSSILERSHPSSMRTTPPAACAQPCDAAGPRSRARGGSRRLGDGASNTVGAGCVDAGASRAHDRHERGDARALGTQARRTSPAVIRRCGATVSTRRRILIGGALSNGGNVREWMMRTMSGGPDSRAACRGAGPGQPRPHGLAVPRGHPQPRLRPHATGIIAGITVSTRPEDILREHSEIGRLSLRGDRC